MKALLSAIKAQLQTDLTYIRDADIFITEDERLIPEAIKFPAVGLKDGEITYEIETQNQETHELFVKIIAYVEIRKPEAAIMGWTFPEYEYKGALDIVADCVTSLKNNTLSGQADVALPVGETEAELLADENFAIVMKTVTMRYVRYLTE